MIEEKSVIEVAIFCLLALQISGAQTAFAQHAVETQPRIIRISPTPPRTPDFYTTEDIRENDRQRVYEAARQCWFAGGSLEHEKKPLEALAKYEEAANILRRSKHGYYPAFGKGLGERYARCLRNNGKNKQARVIEQEFCRLTDQDKAYPQLTWRKLEDENPGQLAAAPQAIPSNRRPYFYPDVNVCGMGIDYSAFSVKDIETTEDEMNKSYVLYRSDDPKRELPIETLEIKNGNGFLNEFKNKITLEEAAKRWGKSEPNRVRDDYCENNCLKYQVIGIEKNAASPEPKTFSIFLDALSCQRYVVDGPGIAFVDPKYLSPETVLQYVEGGLNRAYVTLKPLPDGALPQSIGERLDQQLKSNVGINRIEPPTLNIEALGFSRARRHQKTSPTSPEGAPIPDSR